MPAMKDIAFLVLSLFTIASAAGVAFSKKVVYSGFSLLGTFIGAAGFFVLLSSDFVAVTQVLVYVGGVLVLVIFAIMLTNKVGGSKFNNPTINYKIGVPLIFALTAFLISILTGDRSGTHWVMQDSESYQSMVASIGNALLQEYVLPFEVVSLVLLGALVGALVIVRREVK